MIPMRILNVMPVLVRCVNSVSQLLVQNPITINIFAFYLMFVCAFQILSYPFPYNPVQSFVLLFCLVCFCVHIGSSGGYFEKDYGDVRLERPPFHVPSATPQDPAPLHYFLVPQDPIKSKYQITKKKSQFFCSKCLNW